MASSPGHLDFCSLVHIATDKTAIYYINVSEIVAQADGEIAQFR